MLLQPHHLVSPFLSPVRGHQTPLALLWAQGGSSFPFALLLVAQAKFSLTQNGNLTSLQSEPAPQLPDPDLGVGKGGWGVGTTAQGHMESRGEARRTPMPVFQPMLFPGTLQGSRGPAGL